MEQASRRSSADPIPWPYGEDSDRLALPNVLVVEDDRDIRDMLSALLDMSGYAVRACATAEEALDALREEAFDLMLTDYALPGRTGLWLIEQAAAEGLKEATPVMMMTAHPHVAAAGDYEVIYKPFDVDDLIERIRRRTEHAKPPRRQSLPANGMGSFSDGSGPSNSEPVELVLYVNAKSPQSAAVVHRLRKALAQLNSSRAKLTICEVSEDQSTASLERATVGPRT